MDDASPPPLPGPAPAPDHAGDVVAFAFIPILLAALTFGSIVRCFFHMDDFFHLYVIANKGFTEFVLMPFGGHLLVLRNLAFYLCHRVFGMAAEGYFWLVLLVHLLNVYLLFRVILHFTGSRALACVGAALWGTSPPHAATLGWYSVFGQVLCATLVLLTLARVGALLDDPRPVRPRSVAAWGTLVLAASTCFGTGLGVALVFPIAIGLLIGSTRLRAGAWVVLWSVPLVVGALYTGLHWHAAADSDHRFAILGVVLGFATQGRLILEMLTHLLGYGSMALVLGFFGSAKLYPGPAATGVGLALGLALLVAAARSPNAIRRHLLALAILAVAPYAAIAAGRASLYAGYFGSLAETAVEGRYHYLALAPMTVMLALVVRQLAPGGRPGLRLARGLFPMALATLLLGLLLRPPAIDHHQGDRKLTEDAVVTMNLQIAIQADRSKRRDVVLDNQPFPAVGPLLGWAFPGTVGLYMIYNPTNFAQHRRIHFTVPREQYIAAVIEDARLATLVTLERPKPEPKPGAPQPKAGGPDAGAPALPLPAPADGRPPPGS